MLTRLYNRNWAKSLIASVCKWHPSHIAQVLAIHHGILHILDILNRMSRSIWTFKHGMWNNFHDAHSCAHCIRAKPQPRKHPEASSGIHRQCVRIEKSLIYLEQCTITLQRDKWNSHNHQSIFITFSMLNTIAKQTFFHSFFVWLVFSASLIWYYSW